MVDIHDYDIQCIEHEILWKYVKSPCDYPDCDCLLSLRRDMINKRVLAHQEEILPDIIAFNDALTAALRELYDRAQRLRLNAILVTTTRNFIPFKLRTGRIYGMLSVMLVGIGYTMMVCR